MFGLNEREAARKSSMKENLRGFLFKGISLLGDFNPQEMYFSLKVCVFTNDISSFSTNAKIIF